MSIMTSSHDIDLEPTSSPGPRSSDTGKSEAWKVATWYLALVLVPLVLTLVLASPTWIDGSTPFVGDALDSLLGDDSLLGYALVNSFLGYIPFLWILAGWLPWGLAVAGTRGGATRFSELREQHASGARAWNRLAIIFVVVVGLGGALVTLLLAFLPWIAF
jgi:hypothetical protein